MNLVFQSHLVVYCPPMGTFPTLHPTFAPPNVCFKLIVCYFVTNYTNTLEQEKASFHHYGKLKCIIKIGE